jgi:hypothetical protein
MNGKGESADRAGSSGKKKKNGCRGAFRRPAVSEGGDGDAYKADTSRRRTKQ